MIILSALGYVMVTTMWLMCAIGTILAINSAIRVGWMMVTGTYTWNVNPNGRPFETH